MDDNELQEIEEGMDTFCSPQQFWTSDNIFSGGVNGSRPSLEPFTLCFQDTLILYTICVLFWIMSAIYFLCRRRKLGDIPFNWLIITKVVLCFTVISAALCDSIYSIVAKIAFNEEAIADYYFLSPVVLALTMILASLLILFQYNRGIRSSSVLIIFWVSLLVYGSIKISTLIYIVIDSGTLTSKYFLCTFSVEYFAFVLQFLLTCIPEPKARYVYGRDDDDRRPSPEESVSFYSLVTWWWLNGLMWRGARRVLTHSDLYDIHEQDKSNVNSARFQQEWNKEVRKAGSVFVKSKVSTNKSSKQGKPSLVFALCKAFGYEIFIAGLFKFVYDMIAFVNPLLLNLLIAYVNDQTISEWKGYVYATFMFLVAVTQLLIYQQYFQNTFTAGMRIRAALIATIYKKSLVLSGSGRRKRTVGEIVNLMSIDANRFIELLTYVHLMWSGCIQIIVALVLLYFTLGLAIFAGFTVLVLLVPLTMLLYTLGRYFQGKMMAIKDTRIKVIYGLLSGMKIIKLYGWEIPFGHKIRGIRKAEVKNLRKMSFLQSLVTFIWYTTDITTAIVTFATYCFIFWGSTDPSDRLTAQKIFVSLALFDILRYPLTRLPMTIASLIQSSVSVTRISSFLLEEELDPDNSNIQRDNPAGIGEEAVSVTGGTFTWDKDSFTVSNIDLSVNQGELVAVVGTVGSGKSSLISALLGEMEKVEGDVTIRGSIAYVPQIAWIQNATIKDNILFGRPFNKPTYDQVLRTCALQPDLDILPGGDKTEIGEKGINLSGGQKQRVSLARAVYQDSDVYFLDDPLSAVDAHVGKQLFDQVIGPKGVLNGKARILVTHGLAFLPQCDKIVVMTDGRISEIGTYTELIDQDGAFAEFLHSYGAAESGEEQQGLEPKSPTEFKEEPESLTKKIMKETSSSLIVEEKVAIGMVRFSVIMYYIKSCTYLAFLVVLFFNVASTASYIVQSLWLARWSNLESQDNVNVSITLNLGVYSGLGLFQMVGMLLGSVILAFATVQASVKLHNGMLHSILRSPMSFFDTTPLGRILNRFSKDMTTSDEKLPLILNLFLLTMSWALSTILVICIASPWFILFVLPLVIFYAFVQRFYVATSRQLKRLETTSHSKIYSHFEESVNGASSIRAYNVADAFCENSAVRVDNNNIALYPSNNSTTRWLSVRLDFIGALIVLGAALFAALQRNYPNIFGRIDPGLAGLSISEALMMTSVLTIVVRLVSDLETSFVCVERIKEYSELPSEAANIIPSRRPPSIWPSEGAVHFSHYSTRYRPGLDLVLRDVTFDIPGGQKVGIVGRTGAGKSSLTLALFRIIEAAQGAIYIDGVDISTYGLCDIRSRITIIPQDPVLFSGTLRFNLDPFSQYTDDDLWRSLKTAHLSEYIQGLTEGLNYSIDEGGGNLSVGQRQLVCLARALLRKTKVLVLDEATAAVDLETDDLIQRTVSTEFADCTILTIAHRLNTIMDYDRVMVLDGGRIAEFDTPQQLLQQKGLFYGLAKDAGLA